LCIGAGLRIWQYLANSSLWIDELALTRNIIDRPLSGLWLPLDYAQVAPVGFLFVQKFLTRLLGTNEFVLRAFPLACGLFSLALFWSVSKRLLNGWGVAFAVGLFSLGIPFIYFSSQVKQYSSDVAIALLLLLAALNIHERGVTFSRALSLGLLGAAAVWFSQPALLVMAGTGTAFALLALRQPEGQNMRWLWMTAVLWAGSGAAAVVHSLSNVTASDQAYFQWFWSNGFMPMPPRTLSEVGWLPGKLTWVFGAFGLGLGHTNGGLNYRWSPVFTAVMLYGFWVLWRTQRHCALFLLLPVLVAIALSALSIYPFTARLLAFLIPFFLLAVAAGASALLTRLPDRFQFLGTVLLAVLAGAPIFAIAGALPPSRIQHVRPLMAQVSEQLHPGDRIYVYSGAGLAFSYYAPRFGIRREVAIVGRCALGNPRNYFRELDKLRGQKRVWLVATHEQASGELDLILGYLDQLGRRVETVTSPGSSGRLMENAYAYLYDLSDLAKAASTSAETHPLPLTYKPLSESAARWGCYGITGGGPGD
jgi:hypothetical protein